MIHFLIKFIIVFVFASSSIAQENKKIKQISQTSDQNHFHLASKKQSPFDFFRKKIKSRIKKDELTCKHIYPIQLQYILKHIQYSSFSKTLGIRTVDQMIKSLDRNKLYFLQSDIVQIKNWLSQLFKNLSQSDCQPLDKLYDLFYKRVKERRQFAQKELTNSQFKLDDTVTLVLDTDKKKYALNKKALDGFHRKYIQYEIANVMLAEEDLQKAKEYLIGMYERMAQKVYSWDPTPSPERLQYCQNKDEKNKLVKTCKYEKWYAIYLNSFARALDPHSSYLSRYDLDDFRINMDLSLEGVGALLSSQYGYTTIERLLPGGAAKRSGKIKKRDQIMAIGQTRSNMINIYGWDLRDVVQMVRGKQGTTVHLKILRTGKEGKKYKFIVSLIRNKIHLKDSEASISYSRRKNKTTQHTVGVIRIPSFYGGGGSNFRSVSKDVRNLIREAKKKKVSALVLDLTGNGGGILSEAVDVAGLFIEKGSIVRQITKNFNGQTIYFTLEDKDNRIEYTGPLVVLVDRSSASASEIVAGALKDYKRAVIVGGDHTFGKGSIQSVEDIDQYLGATKTTIGLFFIPSGKSTQNLGIESDIPFMISDDDIVEKKLDYALPNQHTTSFLTRNVQRNWNKMESKLIKKLKIRSGLRVKKDDKFKKLKKEIAEYNKKIKNKKEIEIKTLLSEAKERNEERKKEDLDDFDIHDPRFKKKYLERADVQEAVNVAWDMVLMTSSVNAMVKQN